MGSESNPLEKLLKGKPDEWPAIINKAIDDSERAADACKVEMQRHRDNAKNLRVLLATVDPSTKPEKKQRRASKLKTNTRTDKPIAERMYDFLAVSGAAVKPAIIADELSTSTSMIYQVFNKDQQNDCWFVKTPDGYAIARAGDQ